MVRRAQFTTHTKFQFRSRPRPKACISFWSPFGLESLAFNFTTPKTHEIDSAGKKDLFLVRFSGLAQIKGNYTVALLFSYW